MKIHQQHEQHEEHARLHRHELKGIQAGCLDKAMVDKMNDRKEREHKTPNVDVSAGRLPIGGSQPEPTVYRKRPAGIGPL